MTPEEEVALWQEEALASAVKECEFLMKRITDEGASEAVMASANKREVVGAIRRRLVLWALIQSSYNHELLLANALAGGIVRPNEYEALAAQAHMISNLIAAGERMLCCETGCGWAGPVLEVGLRGICPKCNNSNIKPAPKRVIGTV